MGGGEKVEPASGISHSGIACGPESIGEACQSLDRTKFLLVRVLMALLAAGLVCGSLQVCKMENWPCIQMPTAARQRASPGLGTKFAFSTIFGVDENNGRR
jgi:hypothetical protein